MKPRRRHRMKGRYESGKTFAYVPTEVIESDAYRSLPDWAKAGLWAIAAKYHGHSNGDLSLTWPEARLLGVSNEKKLRAGLRLIERTELLVVTRPGGNVRGGEKEPTLYALSWWAIDESPKYEVPLGAKLMAPNGWARWQRPPDWAAQIKAEFRRAKYGSKAHSMRGEQAAPTEGSGKAVHAATRGEQKRRFDAPRGVGSSKDLGWERDTEEKVRELIRLHPQFSEFDIAVAIKWKLDLTRIRAIRDSMPPGEATEAAA
jgi:hypothetical protein